MLYTLYLLSITYIYLYVCMLYFLHYTCDGKVNIMELGILTFFNIFLTYNEPQFYKHFCNSYIHFKPALEICLTCKCHIND